MSFEALAKQAVDIQNQSNSIDRLNGVGNTFDPDKPVGGGEVSSLTDEGGFDPDKVVEPGVQENSDYSSESEAYDPDKPIEPEKLDNTEQSKRELDSQDGEPELAKTSENQESRLEEIRNLWSDYVDDLMAKAGCSETVDVDKLSNYVPEYTDSKAVREFRSNFEKSKERLISEWETVNNQAWPTYKNDVYITNNRGQQILMRRAGDRYDAHHVVPLCMGGGNISSNITPMHVRDHMDIHADTSPYGKIKNSLEEMGR